MSTIQDLIKAYPEMDIIDEEEEDRLESIRMYDFWNEGCWTSANQFFSLMARGKGAPKKKRTAEGMVGKVFFS
jgi:hypothetical protein